MYPQLRHKGKRKLRVRMQIPLQNGKMCIQERTLDISVWSLDQKRTISIHEQQTSQHYLETLNFD
jgi:hypothetical protein